ncbi:MAG: hypothetical protein WCO16_02810 [bacterium]
MKSINYEVIFEKFTERHFIKSFAKKYKGSWDITLQVIKKEFEQVDLLFLKNVAETIVEQGDVWICKTEFKIAGTNESRHGSGNRCIIAVNKKLNQVRVLLIYLKNDLGGHNETAEWKGIVRENYEEWRGLMG